MTQSKDTSSTGLKVGTCSGLGIFSGMVITLASASPHSVAVAAAGGAVGIPLLLESFVAGANGRLPFAYLKDSFASKASGLRAVTGIAALLAFGAAASAGMSALSNTQPEKRVQPVQTTQQVFKVR